MHNLGVLMTLTGGLAAALVFGFLAHRLKISPIVGYLLAGVVVIHRQVLREEAFLRQHYGDEYAAYCRRVRRYV